MKFKKKCLVKPMIFQKMINLLSKTGLGRSGHDQITTFGLISHVSGPKLSFEPKACKI